MKNRLEHFDSQMDRDKLRIPLDLGEWVDREVLLAWVREEIETLDWGNPELERYLAAHPDYRPKALLTLMSYAYATGVLESEEMVSALRSNPDFKDLRPDPWLAAKDIERFRRENRALLKWGLVRVLTRALQSQCQLTDLRSLAGVRATLAESAAERLDMARHMDRAAQGA